MGSAHALSDPLSLLAPHHLVDHAGVALDDLDHLVGHILGVIGHRDAVVAVFPHRHGGGDGLLDPALRDAGQHKAALVQGFRPLGGGADADGREGMADAQKETRLLRQRARIAHHAEGVHLQVVVVVEAQRLMQFDPLVQPEVHRLQPLAAARMAGVEDRHVIGLGQVVDGGEQVDEVFLGVDVFLPMGGEQHIFLRFQAQTLQHVAGLDLGKVGVQHLGHGAPRDKGPLLGGALGVQVAAGVLGIAHVHIGDVVHNAAVGLLGQALVKAAVAGLHVEDGDVQPLGADGRKAAVGVAQNQQRVGFLLHHQGVGFGNDVADGLAQIFAHRVQVKIRRTKAQVLKKDLVEGIVVVLPRVDEDLVEIFVALLDDGGQPDDLRPGADDGHELQFLHRMDSFSNFFKECVRVMGIELFIGPHDGHQVLGITEVDDVVRIPGQHVNCFHLVA